MAEHTAAQKRFIVLRLAAFETPRAICDAFKVRFPDTDCREEDVIRSDPRTALLPPALEAEFYAERARVLGEDLAKVAPYAEQKARLIALSRQAERYEANNQPAEARAVYRQIAEEMSAADAATAPTATPIEAITRTVIDTGHPDPSNIPAAPAAETV